jgi:hypothetical protein
MHRILDRLFGYHDTNVLRFVYIQSRGNVRTLCEARHGRYMYMYLSRFINFRFSLSTVKTEAVSYITVLITATPLLKIK